MTDDHVKWRGHRGTFRVLGQHSDGSLWLFGPVGRGFQRARHRAAWAVDCRATAAPEDRRKAAA